MISPRAVTELHSAACHALETTQPPSLLAASNHKYADELRRLRQENMQLRRDLEDANNRIRALEAADEHQQASSLFMPSSSYADSDDFSVEVSVTSSTTTVQMGSLSTSQNPENRQDIDEQHSSFSSSDSVDKSNDAAVDRSYSRHSQSLNDSSSRRDRSRRNPFAQAIPRKIPELRRLFSSESESSTMSTSIKSIPEVKVHVNSGRNDAVAVTNHSSSSTRKSTSGRAVSSYAMNYFRRANSSDSESSDTASTGGSSPLTFEV